MKPLIDIKIARKGVQVFQFSNDKSPIGYEVTVSRSVAYKAQQAQVRVYNFVMSNIDDVAVKRADELDAITIKIGYRKDGKDLWAPLCNGRVAIWKQEGTDLIITFIEGAVDSVLVLDFLLSSYPLKSPTSAIWPVILNQCYSKIIGIENVPQAVANVGAVSLLDILTQFSDETGLVWFFANENLYLSKIDPATPSRDVQKYQRTGATLETTNPYLILQNVNPLKQVTRLWSFEILFMPDLLPGQKVTFLDNAGLVHTGTIGTISVTACTVTNKAILSVFEEAKNG